MSVKATKAPFLQGRGYEDIASIRATVRHFGDVGTRQDMRSFTRQTLPRVIACLNPRCCDGGYDLTQVIDKLITERIAHLHVALPCRGHDGTPRGRGRDYPCSNSVEIYLEPAYR